MPRVTKAINRMAALRAAENGYRLTQKDLKKTFKKELELGAYIHGPVLIERHYGIKTKYFIEAYVDFRV